MNFAEHILHFVQQLQLPVVLPHGVEVMNPFQDDVTREACNEFYTKYYNDHNQRWMIIGINPGRFGGGITGIPFTDTYPPTGAVWYYKPLGQKTGTVIRFYV